MIRLALACILLTASAQAQSTIFSDDFESGYSNWTMSGLWNAQDASEVCSTIQLPFPSGTHCTWCGAIDGLNTCSYATSPSGPQYLTLAQPLALPNTNGTILLSYRTWAEVENTLDFDLHGAEVRAVGDPSWTRLRLSFNTHFSWRLDTRDLTAWAGQTIELRFFMHTVDSQTNNTEGVFIDDVLVTEDPANTLALTVCAADYSLIPHCGCGTVPNPDRGCRSSFSPTGAAIAGSGAMRLSGDTFTLHMDGMSDAAATVFQASDFSYTSIAGIGGDGISCVSGAFIRLTTRFAPGGVLDFPSPSDPSISVLGLVSAGQTRYYAARYRDAATFCTSATFNITNTISAFWRP